MKKPNNILSLFLDIVIIKIDNEGNILERTLSTKKDFKTSKAKTIYDLFSKEEKFRLKRVLESGFDIKKKYMELSKITGVKEYVDIKVAEHENEKYILIQFFESNRDREIIYDRYIEKLTNLSERDPMTKVFNRQGFDEKIRRLIENSDKKKRLGIIYFDIDNLKKINDTYGLAKRLHKAVETSSKKKFSTTLSIGVHMVEVGDISKYESNSEKFQETWDKQIDLADKAV